MFKILDELSATYTWPVSFNLPASGGKVTQIKFHAEFNRLNVGEEKALGDEVSKRITSIMANAREIVGGSKPEAFDDDNDKVNRHILGEVMVSVGEMDKDVYVAADSEKEAQLLSTRGAVEAILQAYGKSKSGEKAKN